MLNYRIILLALFLGITIISCENPNEYGGKKNKDPKENPPKANLELVFVIIEENGWYSDFEVSKCDATLDTNQYDCNTWLNISLINREQINYNYFYPLRIRSLDIKIDSVQANGIPFLINRSDSNFAKFKIVNAPPDRDTTIFANEFSANSDISFGWNRKEKQLWASFYAKIICMRHRVLKIDTNIYIPTQILEKKYSKYNDNNITMNKKKGFIRKDTTLFLSRPYLDSLYIRAKFLFKVKK